MTHPEDAVEEVIRKITSAVDHLYYRSDVKDGRLDPDTQHAVRILHSRIRLLRRLVAVELRPRSPEAARAAIELSLKKPDRGDLLPIVGRNHAIGRLDCRACDCEYDSGGIGVPLARLCRICGGGIEHAFTQLRAVLGADKDTHVVDAAPEAKTPPSSPESQETSSYEVVRMYQCDVCGSSTQGD